MRCSKVNELSEGFPELEEEIISIIEQGNELSNEEKYEDAICLYEKAFGLMPEPKLEWEMLSSWLAGSFVTAYFKLGKYSEAKEWGKKQVDSDDSDNNTGPLVALGMVCFELNEFSEALNLFDAAYKYGKERAFKGRPEKYLDFYINNKPAC